MRSVGTRERVVDGAETLQEHFDFISRSFDDMAVLSENGDWEGVEAKRYEFSGALCAYWSRTEDARLRDEGVSPINKDDGKIKVVGTLVKGQPFELGIYDQGVEFSIATDGTGLVTKFERRRKADFAGTRDEFHDVRAFHFTRSQKT